MEMWVWMVLLSSVGENEGELKRASGIEKCLEGLMLQPLVKKPVSRERLHISEREDNVSPTDE